jgi:hypothetical protein
MLNEDQIDMVVSTVHAADTLRKFIVNFFGCEVCRVNFDNEYESCAFDRCNRLNGDTVGLDNWLQLPVFLWEFHNGMVNYCELCDVTCRRIPRC